MHIRNIPARLVKAWYRTKLFSRYLWNRHIRRVQITEPPIFIVGCGHSGTSLLLAILGSHSKIYAVPYESSVAFSKTPASILKSFEQHAIAAGKPRWVEKTPKHIHCIGNLLALCPDAKIVLILRDGRDVACSIQDRTSSLETGIRRWVEDNRAGRQFWGHPQVFVTKYEYLIERFEGAVTDILAFVGEQYEGDMRQYHRTRRFFYSDTLDKPQNSFGRNHRHYRNWQINQPLFDGRRRWGRLSEEELALVSGIGKEMLWECGYFEQPPLHHEGATRGSP
jgi:hypothetical protein